MISAKTWRNRIELSSMTVHVSGIKPESIILRNDQTLNWFWNRLENFWTCYYENLAYIRFPLEEYPSVLQRRLWHPCTLRMNWLSAKKSKRLKNWKIIFTKSFLFHKIQMFLTVSTIALKISATPNGKPNRKSSIFWNMMGFIGK